MKVILNQIIKTLPSSNAAIKNTASTIEREGWYPAFSASGQDVWLPDYRFEQKGIVVSAVGARCGKAFKADGKWNVCANTHVLSVDEQQADRDYFWYLLNNENWWIKGGSAQPFVKIADSLKRSVEIPSLEEQKKRARNMDGIRKLIDGQIEKKNLLDELVKARFVEMFGDPETNPNGYPIKTLSENIEFLTSGSRGWAKYCVENGSEWFITIKNVKNCNITVDNMQPINAPNNAEAKRTKVKEGDLLISITADLGRTGVVSKEIADHGAYINQHLTCIRLDRRILNPLYVAYFMESPAGKEQFIRKNQNAVKAGLNFDSINSLRLIVPPIETQDKFVQFVNQIDKSKFEVQKKIDLYTELLNKKMDEYFNSEAN